MKRIYTKTVSLWALFLLLLGTACQNERDMSQVGKSSRTLHLSAFMPGGREETRVALEEDLEDMKFKVRWQANDEVTFVFEQGRELTLLTPILVGATEADGKQAKFDVKIPESIDIRSSYTLYAFCGMPGSGVQVIDNEIIVDLQPIRVNSLKDLSVPVIAKVLIEPSETSEEKDLRFTYLGSIEYVSLKNSSESDLRVFNCHLYSTNGDAEEWRYRAHEGSHYLYNPMTDVVYKADGWQADPIREAGEGVTIAPGGTHIFAVWHRPNGKNIPEFAISMQTDNGIVTSDNRKTSKTFAMSPGEAYRVQAEWKTNSLTILGEGVVKNTPSFITLTTGKAVGEKIRFVINAEEKDKSSVWIDLNNNGVEDNGEGVTVFFEEQEYILGAQTITVHGNVTGFNCRRQNVTSLDVSNNTALTDLNCQENQLTALDVSSNTALTWLYCSKNQLTSLDVSSNTALTWLDCGSNLLTSLDVSSNTALTWLDCWGNQLTSLDVSSNTALQGLSCYKNKFTSLDVSSNTALIWLYCWDNHLISLDVSSNTALTWLDCSKNQLTSLDVSSNTALTRLYCWDNHLTSLDVSSNTALTWLYCCYNQLTSLDVSSNTALQELHCGSNHLTSLDVSSNTALTRLYCYGNKFTSLDVSSNTALQELYCGSNLLTSLDVSSNTALTWLDCRGNRFTSLDVSSNTALTGLNCHATQLTSLDVSRNSKLKELYCESSLELSSLKISGSIDNVIYCNDCKLSAETLNTIFETLPDVRSLTDGRKELYIGGNEGAETCDKSIATKKGWRVY